MKTFLTILISSTFALLSLSAEDEAFREFDRNGDKIVTYVEFATQQKVEFDALDRNRDQQIAKTEFEASEEEVEANEAEGEQETVYEVFILPAFADMDKDGNESLSLIEFGGGVKVAFAAVDKMESGEEDSKVTLAEYQMAVEKAKFEAMQAEAATKGSQTKKGSAPK